MLLPYLENVFGLVKRERWVEGAGRSGGDNFVPQNVWVEA